MTPFQWTDASVAEALEVPGASADVRFSGVSTDSRAVRHGDLFVALTGDHFDGHDYLEKAVAAGACGLVVSRSFDAGKVPSVPVYKVPDTLVAYGQLAAHKRVVLGPRVVGITGSSGKTTTKDLTKGAIAGSLRTHATEANYNNRVGLPRTILEAPHDTEILVLEMGTNEPGEIAALTEVARPDVGVVTTVSESHLEGLGSLEGVLGEKLSLLQGLGSGGGAIVGDRPEMLPVRARELVHDVRIAGLSDIADPELRATDMEVQVTGAFRFRWQGHSVVLRIPGEAAVVDALLALGVAQSLDVPAEAAVEGVGLVEAGWLRGEVRHLGDLTLVLDCYNANPQSVRAALRTLERMPSAGARVLVLGSMLELGDQAADLHTSVLAEARSAPLDRIYATGLFRPTGDAAAGVPVEYVEDINDETVLLKASRGVKLERVVPTLERRFADAQADSTSTRGAS
jgi:UDP-N-acetylmuramoyl-tripeptide--D-alanyl-D-alanine ligase